MVQFVHQANEAFMTTLGPLIAEPPPLRTDADGVVRVGGTRVRLDTVVTTFNSGCGAEEIVLKYPSLDLKDVYSVIAYYLWHRAEIDAYLRQRRQLEEATLQELDSRFPPAGVRDRLLNRRSKPA
jgi:uncharacterized protein (DUF433 family)